MKTAISVAADVLEEADKAAAEIGVSRSRLFTIAMQNYLRERRNQRITDRLNEVYKDGPTPEDKRILAGIKRHFRSVVREQW